MEAGADSSYDDGWDWPFLLYVGLTKLNLTERRFWQIPPVKFKALLDVHIKLGTPEKEGGN